MKRVVIILCLMAWLSVSASSGVCATVKPSYRVAFKASGDDALDPLAKASSFLMTLQKTRYPGDFALVSRIRSDYRNIAVALASRGYYDGQVNIQVKLGDGFVQDGRDPHLLERLQKIGCKTQCVVSISVKRNTQYRIGSIKFQPPPFAAHDQGTVSKVAAPKPVDNDSTGKISGQGTRLSVDALKAFGLSSGASAVAADVLAARDRLMHYLLETGHAKARVETPDAFVDPDKKRLDLVFFMDAGPKLLIGPIGFAGQKRTRLSFMQNKIHLREGVLYQPSRIEAARQELLAAGIFSYVGVKNAPPLVNLNLGQHGLDSAMPIRFTVKEAKRRNIAAQAGYSTDLGGRAGVDWTYRNLFGRAERLKLTALMTGISGSAQQGIGYDFYADLLKPNFMRQDQNLDLRVEGIRQVLYSYHQTALIARGGLVRKVGQRWNLSSSLSIEQEQIQQFGATNDYFIASIPLAATYDSTDVKNPMAPATHGFRVNLNLTPSESFQDGNSFFTIMSAMVSHYIDFNRFGLTKPGQTVLALRGLIGTVQGASVFQIPPDQRLYAGGPATVRGFRYQGIGPQNGKYAVGGTSLDAGTIELRQHLFGKVGMAAFVDAGQVGTTSRPFQGTLRVGYGAGARYETPIGPVRLDFALPANRPQNGDKWEFYVGLGETF